ncbi:MAG: hypothetical protein IM568_08460 [Flavobacterium sp.]|nr:hypothetical protein [Flavobacterium sp.]
MKKISIFILLAFLSFSCSDDSDENSNDGAITNNPVSGELYGTPFTIGGGKGVFDEVFGVDSVELYLTTEDLGCETLGFSDFPITIIAPRIVGVHTTDVYATFNDPDSSDFISLSGGITVEIISITDDLVVGKVRAVSTSTDNSIEGKFELPICE